MLQSREFDLIMLLESDFPDKQKVEAAAESVIKAQLRVWRGLYEQAEIESQCKVLDTQIDRKSVRRRKEIATRMEKHKQKIAIWEKMSLDDVIDKYRAELKT